MKRIIKSKKGFTLIELLVVIAIMGILAAIAVPSTIQYLGSTNEQAEKSYTEDILSQARLAVTELNTAEYPVTSSAVVDIINDEYLVNSSFPYPVYHINDNAAVPTVDQVASQNEDFVAGTQNMIVVYAGGDGMITVYFYRDGAELPEYRQDTLV